MIDVITLTRDHPDWLAEAMESMRSQGVPFRGWCVDNSESGSAGPVARRFRWEWVTRRRNLSFSEGNNWAAKMGTNPWILLLNDDAILHPGCVQALVAHDADLCGPVQLFRDGRIFQAGIDASLTFACHGGSTLPPCREVVGLGASVLLVRRRVWEALGGLDEAFVWSYDDVDFCLRAREKGYSLMACSEAFATHEQLGSRGEVVRPHEDANRTLLRQRWGV